MNQKSYYLVSFGKEGENEQIDPYLQNKCHELLKEYGFKLKNLGGWGCPWYFIDIMRKEYIPGRPGVCYGKVIGKHFMSVEELKEVLMKNCEKVKKTPQITLEELKEIFKTELNKKDYPVEQILKDMEKNPKEYEKYLTMEAPVSEILADWT